MASIILTEILHNPSSLLISLFGMFVVYYLVYRTSSFRFGPAISVLVMAILWLLRYFGFTIYVSKYLSGKYSGEEWFLTLTSIMSMLIIFLGIFLIALIYKGNLLKNLLMTCITELFVSMIFLMPGAILSKEPQLERNFLINGWTPTEVVLIILLFILCILTANRMSPWLERYRNWEPKHPAVLVVILALYFIVGMFSNIRYAMQGGKTQVLIFIPLVVFVLAFLMFGYFNNEWVKEIQKRNELQRYEESIMKHYQQLMIQSVRIEHYNKDIRQAIEDLTEKILQAESGHPSSRVLVKDGELMAEDTRNTKNLAKEYLGRLEEEYSGISFSKYSEDIWLNEFLTEYEQRFSALNVPVRIFFFPDKRPEGLGQQDCEDIMKMLFDEALAGYASGTVSEDSLFSLLGGRSGPMTILSCEYDGNLPSGQRKRKMIRLAKKMKNDIEMEEKNGRAKIILAYPLK